MSQYTINIGALPNDGTGDPLRTAFNETNLNFNQVWATGLINSNVQVANNTILTTNTNGNLVLAPNGIGLVQSNVSIVPNLANIRNLGSSTRRWSTVYTQYLNATQINLSGDLTVAGNLTVQGNIIQVGNIVTETLTIQLANAASTANAANGAGITVGANDNIATILYNSTGNVWTTNIGVSSVGNISAPYFVGNGSLLTGLAATYGNANVVTLLSGFGSNTVSTTGNITGGFIFGNISQANGFPTTYGNSNVTTLLAALGSNTISTSGNITGGNIFGNIQAADGNTSVMFNQQGFLGADAGFSYDYADNTLYVETVSILGKNTHGDNAVYVGVTGYTALGSNVVAQFAGNADSYTQINFQNINPSPTASGDYIITANNGTDSANFIDMGIAGNTWDGTQTNSLGNAVSANDGYLYVNGGNLVVGTFLNSGNVINTWKFGSNGNLTLPGANANYTIATQGGYITVGNLLIGQGGALFNSNNDSWALYGNISDPGATIFIPSNADAGNGTPLYIESQQSNVEIRSGSSTWNFDSTGNLALPQGGVVYETSIPDGGLNGKTIALVPSGGTNADQQLLIYPTVNDANHLHLTTGNLYNTELFLGDDNLYVKLANTGNIVVNSNDATGNTAQWTFGTNESLTLPGGSRLRPLGANLDIFAGTGSYVNLITSDESSYMGVGGAGGYVVTAGGTWNFGTTGNLTAPGNVSAVGNITGGNLITAGSGGAITMSGGNITGAGNISAGNVSTTGNITGAYILGNGSQLTGLPATYGNANVATFLATFGSNTVSTTGNITSGNLITGGVVSATGNVQAGNIRTAGQVSATGNIVTAGNFVGNGAALTNVTVSVAGNIVGTQSNVTVVAGAYNWAFDNTGNLTLPGNTFAVNYANNTPVNVVTRFESSWTVPTGNSTQSFTVTPNETYYMWVDCNIPNGILTWNATATVTNTNVPVVGAQYAWVYNGGGTPIDFTSIPNQFVGTSNTIVRSSVAPSATTNQFDFGLNNTSGGNVTVRYGWIAIS